MKRYPGLDLLRAVAILWVMLFHGITEGVGSPIPAIGRLGWMGVDLFFVLSGYLIGSQLLKSYVGGETPSLRAFYLRRAFRILPVYWVVLGFYYWVPSFRESPGLQPAWQFLTFTENLLVDYQHNQAFSHAWSLCVEEHFYLVFPLLVWLLMRRPSAKKTGVICLAVVVGGMVLRGYVWLRYLAPGHTGLSYPGQFVELIYYPTYMRLDGLLAGVVLATIRWFRPRLWTWAMARPNRVFALGLAVLGAAIWVARARTTFAASLLGFPFLSWGMALVMVACTSPAFILGRFRVPGAEGIATITFSLYLSHKMAWHVIRVRFPALVQAGGAQAFLVYLGIALMIGSMLYFLVERPFLRLRDLQRGRRSVVKPGALAVAAES